jgi:hypothetical protein
LLAGYDFVDGDPDPEAGNPHGTFVTGLLAANACNDYGIAGVDWRCSIVPVKVVDLSGEGTVFELVQGLDFVAGYIPKIDVVNMSLGEYPPSNALKEALHDLREAGHVLVASAGNSGVGSAPASWPGASPDVISVGSTDDKDVRAKSSATGDTLDMVAPGKGVITTGYGWPGVPEYQVFTGTSASSPVVSGIASLLRSMNPYLTVDAITEALYSGSVDGVGPPSEDTVGWDPYYGNGRASLFRSLQSVCNCLGGEALISVPQEISAGAGETLALQLDAYPEHAGESYWIVGSVSGSSKSGKLGHLSLPFGTDEYTRFTIDHANSAVLVNTAGSLDGEGRAVAFLALPYGLELSGPISVSHVAVFFGQGAQPIVSNATTCVIVP